LSELIRLGEHSYYIPSHPNVGVFVEDGRAYLLDSGLNETQAAEYLRLIQEQGWTLQAVFNTHYHADHVGGNHYLQEVTGCGCYCPMPAFANDPVLNPSTLFGAYPPEAFHTDIFLAQACQAENLTQDILPQGLRLIPLPGHCRVQYGIMTCDEVFYCADAVIGEEELDRFKISHLYDLDAYFASMELLEATPAKWYVPSHETALRDIRDLVARNRQSCLDLIDWILADCAGEGLTHDALLKAVFDRIGRNLHLVQYALSGCTLRAYLSYLLDRKQLTARVRENLLYFCTV